jgi:CBS domain containing-hemolysin-like protein
VHIKDLLPLFGNKDFDINTVLREILYIPPSMKSLDLLVKMRTKRVHMALVLDEYGGTDGLVTMEDLMEEIVGEIEDEHDDFEEEEIKEIDVNTFEINARIPVEYMEKRLGVRLMPDDEDEDFDTVGGLIFFMLGHVPEVGEVVKHPSGYDFEVLEADPRRIKKLLVRMVS